MRTNGDVLVVIESLIRKGLITESMKDGKLIYNAKKIADGVFIRYMDCNFITNTIEESLQHSEKFNHMKDVNLYEKEKFQAVLQEIMREEGLITEETNHEDES